MLDLALSTDIFIEDKLTAAIQELDILFNTKPGEVIGDSSYGVNWLQFLYTLTPMESEMTTYVTTLINLHTYYAASLDVDVDCEFVQGQVSSMYYVMVGLRDPNDSSKGVIKTYEIR